MSILNGILTAVDVTCKGIGIGMTAYDCVQVSKDENLTKGEKATIITSNVLYMGTATASAGVGIARFVTLPELPVQVKSAEHAYNQREFNVERLPLGHDNLRQIPGSSQFVPTHKLDSREERTMPTERGELGHTALDKAECGINMALAIAKLQKVAVRKWIVCGKNGIDIHDVLEILAAGIEAQASLVNAHLTYSPDSFGKHSKTIKIIAQCASHGSSILSSSKKLEQFGHLIKTKIQQCKRAKQAQTAPQTNRTNTNKSTTTQTLPQTDLTNNSGSLSNTTPQTNTVEEMMNRSDREVGEEGVNSTKRFEAFLTSKISDIQEIPEELSCVPLFNDYKCELGHKPIRFILQIQDKKSKTAYYEKVTIQEWFRSHPNQIPPGWPPTLQNECSYQALLDFNEGHFETERLQALIDDGLLQTQEQLLVQLEGRLK